MIKCNEIISYFPSMDLSMVLKYQGKLDSVVYKKPQKHDCTASYHEQLYWVVVHSYTHIESHATYSNYSIYIKKRRSGLHSSWNISRGNTNIAYFWHKDNISVLVDMSWNINKCALTVSSWCTEFSVCFPWQQVFLHWLPPFWGLRRFNWNHTCKHTRTLTKSRCINCRVIRSWTPRGFLSLCVYSSPPLSITLQLPVHFAFLLHSFFCSFLYFRTRHVSVSEKQSVGPYFCQGATVSFCITVMHFYHITFDWQALRWINTGSLHRSLHVI